MARCACRHADLAKLPASDGHMLDARVLVPGDGLTHLQASVGAMKLIAFLAFFNIGIRIVVNAVDWWQAYQGTKKTTREEKLNQLSKSTAKVYNFGTGRTKGTKVGFGFEDVQVRCFCLRALLAALSARAGKPGAV